MQHVFVVVFLTTEILKKVILTT